MRIALFHISILAVLLLSFDIFAMSLSGTEYTITSNSLTYVPEKARIFLKENVRIVNEMFTVTAQEVDVVLEEQKEALSFSSESINELLFRRSVTFVYTKRGQDKPLIGKGNSARYDIKKDMLYMYGNVVVETDGNVVEGEEIAINLLTNTVQVQGTRDRPVEVLVRPRKEEL